MSFPKYPKYKASGVDWLGDVPEHWMCGRLRYLSDLIVDGTHHSPVSNVVGDYLYITAKNIKENGFDLSEITFVSAEDHADIYQRCPVSKGDVLYIKDGATAGIAMVNTLSEEFSLLSSVALIRPSRSKLSPEFVAYQLNAGQFKNDALNRLVGGAMTRLTLDHVSRFVLALPPPAEQRAIVELLDRETAKIDESIAEQRRLIELLKEKRQTVISHAVTKGLNPHAPMKDSGIEWLGEVPAHWQVARLRYYAEIENGTTPSRDNLAYWADGNIPWLSSGEVNQYRIVEAGELITEAALRECSLRLLPRGTTVVGMIGQGKTRGSSASLLIEACINQNLAAVIPGELLVSDYTLYIFQAMYEYLREFGRGGNQAALNCEILSALQVPIPHLGEQRQICSYLEQQLTSFDALATESERAIGLLQERRTALISAAVTGQIDVRQLADRQAAA